MDDDAAWLCTQAVVSADDDDRRSSDGEEKVNRVRTYTYFANVRFGLGNIYGHSSWHGRTGSPGVEIPENLSI